MAGLSLSFVIAKKSNGLVTTPEGLSTACVTITRKRIAQSRQRHTTWRKIANVKVIITGDCRSSKPRKPNKPSW
jgi:hypothetical protein